MMHCRRRIDAKNNQASKLFCFFSGFTKGMVQVKNVTINDRLKVYNITLSLPEAMKNMLTHYIQLDGVLCEVLSHGRNETKVSTTFELVECTTLENIAIGSRLSLGLLAKSEPSENQGYLIHPSAATYATLANVSILSGHKHTLKFDFVYAGNGTDLQEDKYIGIAGSSLTVKEINCQGGLSRFSIYAGRQTQENTCFNRDMTVGQMVNITPAMGAL